MRAVEFVSREWLDLWTYQRGVTLDFSRPGKWTDNAFIETVTGRFRAERLNAHWFNKTCRRQRNDGRLAKHYNEIRVWCDRQ